MKEPILEVAKEQDARDLPDIVAKEESGNRRDDNEEQGIEPAVSAFYGNAPGSNSIPALEREKTSKDGCINKIQGL